MRLVYIGEHRTPYSSESEISEGFEQLGHTVVRVQEHDCDHAAIPQLAIDEGADAVIWTRTATRNKDAEFAMLSTLEQLGIPTIGLHLDRYWDLKRESDIATEPWFRQTFLFTADGGNQDRFKAAGINHFWFPPATRRDACYIGTPQRQYTSDVGFCGSWLHYHPAEWPHRKQMVEWLQRTYRNRVGIWPKKDQIRGSELNDLCASVKVMVGDSCLATAETSHYWSDRLPRTAGAGGILLHPNTGGLYEHFPTIPTWEVGDWNGLRNLIDSRIDASDSDRHQARIDNVNLASLCHTWPGRLRYVLHTVFGGDWPGEIRPATTDEVVFHETWIEDVYHARNRIREGSVVVDIGANVGFFSIYAAANGGRVLAAEPSERTFKQLKRNLGSAPGINVNARQLAVGAQNGMCSMEAEYFGGGGARITAGSDVNMVTLDRFLAPLHHIDFLKVDAEGSEWAIFGAASKETMEKIDFIAMEFHPYYNDEMAALLRKLYETHPYIEFLGGPASGGYLYARR